MTQPEAKRMSDERLEEIDRLAQQGLSYGPLIVRECVAEIKAARAELEAARRVEDETWQVEPDNDGDFEWWTVTNGTVSYRCAWIQDAEGLAKELSRLSSALAEAQRERDEWREESNGSHEAFAASERRRVELSAALSTARDEARREALEEAAKVAAADADRTLLMYQKGNRRAWYQHETALALAASIRALT